MTKVSEEILQDIVRTIITEVHPEKIILFGSQVNGNITDDSDMDLMIVEKEPFGKHRSRWKELRRIRRLLAKIRIPKDILVFSVDEFEERKHGMNDIIADSFQEGRVLYERF